MVDGFRFHVARPARAEGDRGGVPDGRRHRPNRASRQVSLPGSARSHTRSSSAQKTLDYFHTHVCAPGASGCTSFLGGSQVAGSLVDSGKAPRRRARPRLRYVAAVPADEGQRPRPHRSLHPGGQMKRLTCRSARRLSPRLRCGLGFAHAHLSPPIVPAEEEPGVHARRADREGRRDDDEGRADAADGFSIDSFIPVAGWKRTVDQNGSRRGRDDHESDVGRRRGCRPARRGFQFLGRADSSKTYTFGIRQTYSDGSVVDWNGAESSETPAATIEARPLVRRRRRQLDARDRSHSSSALSASSLGGVALAARAEAARSLETPLGHRPRRGRRGARAAGRGVGARGAPADVPIGERNGQHARRSR